jgi:sugar/nucleoside kinase (ribokinase family)
LGGAGNIAHNLVAMGGRQVFAFGVIGDDPFGAEMTRIFNTVGIESSGLVAQASEWDTHVYVKPYEDDQEQNRIDFGNFNLLAQETRHRLLHQLEQMLPQLDVVIINQQVYRGICTSELREQLQALIRRYPAIPWIIDSRHYSNHVAGTIRKINDHEGAALCGMPRAPEEPISAQEARTIAETLYGRWQKPLFLTRREHGCVVYDETGYHAIPGLHIVAPMDPVGAGDSMLAGIAAALAAGRDPVTAAEFGNIVAGVTVQKLFETGTDTPEEILALGSQAVYRA